METHDNFAGRAVAALAGALVAYAAFRVLAPFAAVLAAAAVVAVVVHPLEAALRRRMPPAASCGLLAAGVAAALVLPLSLGGWYLARESLRAYPLVRQAIEGLLGEQGLRSLLLENVKEVGAWTGRAASYALSNAALLAAQCLVFLLGLFLFLRDGSRAWERLRAALPVTPEAAARIEGRAREMTVATVQGVFAVAVLQGALSMIGFWLFGVRFPVLLGFLCMAFSPIPFVGPAVVWVPVAVAAALDGRLERALLLAGWFALVVGVSDNLARPVLIGRRSRIPLALVVVGVLGGIKAFGVLGTFLGPVIVAVGAAAAEVLLEEAGKR